MNVTASVSRTSLGLPALDINDRVKYYLSEAVDSGSVAWRREQVESPYVESKITIGRVRDIVEQKIGIQVLGATQTTIATNIAALVAAFTQDTFTLTIQLDSQTYTWACEAADYTMDWSRERLHAHQVLMAFGFLRHPIPVGGPL